MIHVCFGLHDKSGGYSKFTGTAMLSIFENTSSEVTIHILHDNTLTPENRDRFIQVAERYNQHVNFYNVEELRADKLAELIRLVPAIKTARVSIGAFYRLLIPQILPLAITKCIYLDSDMLVNLDINELWQIELEEKPLAAVPEMEANAYNYKTSDAAKKYLLNAGFVKYDEYFNSGLLMMNLTYLRNAEALIMSGIKWRGEHPQCNCFDQDIFNYLFSKNYKPLPATFDSFICNERSQGRKQPQGTMYHCTSPSLTVELNDPYNRLWFSYFMKTPWFSIDTIANLYNSLSKVINQTAEELKTKPRKHSSLLAGKSRVFVVDKEGNIGWIKVVFSTCEDDEFIIYDGNAKRLADRITAERDKKLFFIRVRGLSKTLTEQGLVDKKDFLDDSAFFVSNKYSRLSKALISVL